MKDSKEDTCIICGKQNCTVSHLPRVPEKDTQDYTTSFKPEELVDSKEMKGIPNKIYLQVDPDNEQPEKFDSTDKDVTWCVDRINDNDVEYVRTTSIVEAITKWARKNNVRYVHNMVYTEGLIQHLETLEKGE